MQNRETIQYPSWLEEWWLAKASAIFRSEDLFDKSAELERAIQAVSDLFTMERPGKFLDYFENLEFLAAYGLFFFPQTFARMQFPLFEMWSKGWRPPNEMDVLDVGAGTGAATFSIASFMRENGLRVKSVDALDHSGTALRIMTEIVRDCRAQIDFDLQTLQQRIEDYEFTKNRYDLIVESFTSNELIKTGAQERMRRMLGSLKENGVFLMLEPASKETSESMERLRDVICGMNGFQILGPCPHHQACPMLNDGRFWCHEVRSWTPPNSLRFLNRHLYRSVQDLKFSFVAVQRSQPTSCSHAMRLVSPVTKVKGRYLFSACMADGSLAHFDVLRKTLNPETERYVRSLQRGDNLTHDRAAQLSLRKRDPRGQ